MMGVAPLVEEQPGWAVVVDHQNVGVPVVVQVAEGGAAAHLRQLENQAGLLRHLREVASADIVDELFFLMQRIGIAGLGEGLDGLDRSVHRQ